MAFASVIVDIPTRALDRPFSYAVPVSLVDEVRVGATVLVSFAHRKAVGYVVGLCDELPAGLDASQVHAVEQVLAAPAFDETGARVAEWMAREYACSPADAIRPFLAPGQNVRMRRNEQTGEWSLEDSRVGAVDDRWVSLTDAANARGNARCWRRLAPVPCASPSCGQRCRVRPRRSSRLRERASWR